MATKKTTTKKTTAATVKPAATTFAAPAPLAKPAPAPVLRPPMPKPAPKKGATLTAEERHQRIAEAAYYLALKKGPSSDPNQNWLEAEAQIDAAIKG